MKVGILTFHRANNYGAVLQAFALNKSLNNLGVDAEEIDYFPDYFKEMYYWKYHFTFKHPGIRTRIKKALIASKLKKRNTGFEKFIFNEIKKSKNIYSSCELLQSDKLNYDVLITGSDQVWNDECAKFDSIFFLDFLAANPCKKYSYAASFNLSSFPNDKINEYRRRLKSYEKYSVREKSGQRLLKELLNVDAEIHCDPTFLIDYSLWNNLANNCKTDYSLNSPYIFVYYVKPSKILMEYTKKLSIYTGLKVYCIPCLISYDVLRKKKYSEYGFEFLPTASPYDFLSLIKNAQYTLSNSFHGTVFSILFRKQFFSVLESDDGTKNNRSFQLLKSLNLTNRIMDSNKRIESIEENIDWSFVDKLILKEKNKAFSYLKEICDL